MKRESGNEGAWDATTTAEERALARALEACEIPAVAPGTVEAIRRRVQAAETARAWIWRGGLALAASAALLMGVRSVQRGGNGSGVLADAEPEATFYAEAEAEWIAPYAEQFEELETTLLAFEALDFDSGDTAFPNL